MHVAYGLVQSINYTTGDCVALNARACRHHDCLNLLHHLFQLLLVRCRFCLLTCVLLIFDALGFIYFALFAFFVELVPYLPDYGGYVRYAVGIVVTVVVGRQAIAALERYLKRQKEAEARPDVERRQELSYDTALARLAKNVCPGCERAVDFKNTGIDYCPHCGICLFDRCAKCEQRKSAFSRFCHACGAPAQGAG